MKFNTKTCALLLATAFGAPSLAFAQGPQKQAPTDSNVNPAGLEATKTGTATDVLNQTDPASKTSTTSREFKKTAMGTTGVAPADGTPTRTTAIGTDSGTTTGRVGTETQGAPALDANSSTINRNASAYDATTSDRTSRGSGWGWMGLLGLTGLFGLMRRPETTDRRSYANRSATGTV